VSTLDSEYSGAPSRLRYRRTRAGSRGSPLLLLFPYSGFIKYTQSITKEASKAYWSEQLAQATRSSWPPAAPKTGTKAKNITKVMVETIDFPRSSDSAITKATVLRAAWAFVLARYSETKDVTFGTTISGRQAPVANLGEMPGPMIAIVLPGSSSEQKRTHRFAFWSF
jgi:hypothetical protein